jgi:hypothetical protein
MIQVKEIATAPIIFDDDWIRCAVCGKAYGLHHDSVDVYMRVEDAAKGVHVRCKSGKGVAIINDLSGNPSSRRGGIVIGFWCENCGERSRLSIAQHKGHETVAYGGDE